MSNRREFIKKAGAGVAGITIGGVLPGFSVASYNRIIGANDRVNVVVAGVNSRGYRLAQDFARQTASEVITICDVDKRAMEKCIANIKSIQIRAPKGEKDFRKALDDKQIDAIAIAMPDHWHTPAALLALQAGKHVYLEKPVSHNPREGEMLIEATVKYGKVVQVGTQRRSWPNNIEAIQHLQNGIIGKVHFGKGWYVGNRQSIGTGKIVAVPDWLDWNLWQGPSPRTIYKDNIVHYNWHWFWHWGTAETMNNGTHTIDLLCWGMNLKYPTKISSMGGRYYYKDDWETPDTQVINMEFENNVSLLWEGHSCSGKQIENSNVGVCFYGDDGSLYIGSDDYKVFNKESKLIKESTGDYTTITTTGGDTGSVHVLDFLNGIQKGTPLKTTVEGGHKCALLLQLANISLRTGRTLNINPDSGHIINDSDAQRFWSRSYEPGWEPKI